MSSAQFRIRVAKFLTNPLLQRKQFALEVRHGDTPTVSKLEVRKELARMYRVKDINSIIVFGFKTQFGGGLTSGFGLIYDSAAACEKFEKKYRLIRHGIIKAPEKIVARRNRRETKNRRKKVRGKEKTKIAAGAKK